MKKRHFNTALFLLVLCLSLVYVLSIWSPSAYAAGITLQADATDTPLVISGTLDGQTTAFSSSIRLTANGGDVGGLLLLASDLHVTSTATSTNSKTIIDRGNISIPAINLTNGQPKDVRVTVSNVTQPDDYQGTLKFLIPGQSETGVLTVPLVLHISILPKVAPVLGANTPVSIQVVHDQFPLDDFFVGLFMPTSYEHNVWNIQIDNQTPAPVTITGVSVVMHGANNNVVLNSTEAQVFCSLSPKLVSPPCTLAANQVTSLQLMLHRDMLPPDDYQGTLRFSLANSATPATVTVDLKVRGGPFWPFIVIIVGVLIGFIAQSMTTALALKQLHLYPTYNHLKEKAKDIKDKNAQKDVLDKLEDMLGQINSADTKATEDAVASSLASIDHRIEVYLKLDQLQEYIKTSGLDATVITSLENRIHNARTELEITNIQDNTTKVDTEVKGIYDDFTNDFNAALPKTAGDNVSPEGTISAEIFRTASFEKFDDLLTSLHIVGEPKKDLLSLKRSQKEIDALVPVIRNNLKKMNSKSRNQHLSWWQQVVGKDGWLRGAALRYKVLRPFLGFVLVAVLILIGLQTLYVSNGTTFGAAGLSDYLGLLLWGISAKVAQSTLQNLPALQGASAARS